jgi:hypothetical protein
MVGDLLKKWKHVCIKQKLNLTNEEYYHLSSNGIKPYKIIEVLFKINSYNEISVTFSAKNKCSLKKYYAEKTVCIAFVPSPPCIIK